MSIRLQLQQAASDDSIVRIYRADLQDGWVDGRVAILGAEFLALAVIDNSIRYDGFNCLRYSDITRCNLPAPHAEFLDSALRLRGLNQPTSPAIDLTSASTLFRTAALAFTIVTIYSEITDPDVAYIGRVIEVTESQLRLQHITPDAEWENDVEDHALRDITRIDVGCSYEDALLTVANAGAQKKARP